MYVCSLFGCSRRTLVSEQFFIKHEALCFFFRIPFRVRSTLNVVVHGGNNVYGFRSSVLFIIIFYFLASCTCMLIALLAGLFIIYYFFISVRIENAKTSAQLNTQIYMGFIFFFSNIQLCLPLYSLLRHWTKIAKIACSYKRINRLYCSAPFILTTRPV